MKKRKRTYSGFWLSSMPLPKHIGDWLKDAASANERTVAAQLRWMLNESAIAEGYKPVTKPANE